MTPPPSQANRPFRIDTPLGEDVLVVARFTGEERVSTLFRFVVEAWSARDDIKASELLLQPVTLKMQMADGTDRKVTGIVNRLVRGAGAPAGLFAYQLDIVPKHWVLSCDQEFDIWQEKTVKDICNDLFADVAVEWKIQGALQPRPYTFRYRESSWHCASRLLEQYGIWYYFDYSAPGAKLVLGNSSSASEVKWATPKMTFHDGRQRDERLLSLRAEYTPYVARSEVRSYSEFAVNSNIRDTSPAAGTHKLPDARDAHYFDSDVSAFHSGITHGGGERAGDTAKFTPSVKQQALLRQQLAEAASEIFVGSGTYAGLQAGAKVEVGNHDIASYDGAYFVVAVRHEGANGAMIAGDQSDASYQNTFECIPWGTTYRPPRTTSWPKVSGSHVGVVVGPSGEEIHTDKFGRVQVAFRWDGESPSLERCCWIRVAQPFAGSQFGMVFLPRIGHEVLVEFLEGNPDNPVVVGSLYNNVNMPPWALPASKTQTGVRTKSTLHGGAEEFNEIRFEDKKGSEQIYVQAQKNLDTLVKHDETRKVGNDRTTVIHNQDEKTVEEADDITTVSKGKQIIKVDDNNREITVKKDQLVNIGDNEKTQVGADYELTVGANATIRISSNRSMDVGGDHTAKVSGKEKVNVSGDQTIEVGGNQSITIDGNGKIELPTGNFDIQAKAGQIKIKATAGITLTCGANSIEIGPAGVTIKGTMVKVEGTAMTEIKAPMTQVKGDGMLMLKGGITMIN